MKQKCTYKNLYCHLGSPTYCFGNLLQKLTWHNITVIFMAKIYYGKACRARMPGKKIYVGEGKKGHL